MAGAPSLRVYDVEEAPDGTVWIGTLHGVQSWDPETDRFNRLLQPARQSRRRGRRGGQEHRNRAAAPSGWAPGQRRGAHRPGHRRPRPVPPQLGQQPHPHQRHRGLPALHDSQGRVWVGTGSGLNRLDPFTGLVTRLTEKDGLPNITIYALAEDAQGRIWGSSNFGLVALDPETLDFAHYQAKDGCQSNEFNMGAAAYGRSGRMYFGGINRLQRVLPRTHPGQPLRAAGADHRLPHQQPFAAGGRPRPWPRAADRADPRHRAPDARPPRPRGVGVLLGAPLRRAGQEPLLLPARGLRQRLDAGRRDQSRHLHEPAARALRLPRARLQQRRRVERERRPAGDRRQAALLEDALVSDPSWRWSD